jgi:hypothetical protein
MIHFLREFNPEIQTGPYKKPVCESFTRAINDAPLQNKRAVYMLIATDACRRCMDDLLALAKASGLIEQLGAVNVQNDLTSSFRWGRS